MKKYSGRDLKVSDIPTILGANKYQSKFDLWHIVKGNLPDREIVSGRAKWANYFSPIIKEVLQKNYDAKLENKSRDFSIAGQVFKGSYTEIVNPGQMAIMLPLQSKLIIVKQISEERLNFDWSRFDNKIPDSERIKAQIQMMISGKETCAFFLLIDSGAQETFTEIESDNQIANRIKKEVREFVESLNNNEEPEPDFSTDGKIISELYPIDKNNTVDMTGDNELTSYLEEMDVLNQKTTAINIEDKSNKEKKKILQNKIRLKLKTASSAKVNNTTITIKKIEVGETITPARSYERMTIKN